MYKSIRVAAHRSAAPLVAVFSDDAKLPRGLTLPARTRQAVEQALKTPGFKAEAGEVASGGTTADGLGLALGLGKQADLTDRQLRIIGARLARRLDRMGINAAKLHLTDGWPASSSSITAEQVGRCITEGAVLGNWRVDFFDGKAAQHEAAQGTLALSSDDAGCTKGMKRGVQLAESANYARQLAVTPPNICNPAFIGRAARKLANQLGLTCKVINYQQAQKLGMGGIVNVGQASDSKPMLIILEHKPPKVRKNTRIALVGKTITYDTGGYSLKPSASMKGMKSDKNGGMAVLGAMHAIASLNLPVHVYGVLPVAENMVSSNAYRPDDIITMYNGITVEVTNTDAEGRLVLADALAYTCEKLKPTAIVDAATLTGGVVVALGKFSAGLWCNHDALRERLETAATVSGERVWHLPLWKEHRDFMRAKHADLWNSGPARDAHPIQGAAFLSFFVDEDVPWAHLDIAGMSDVDSDDDIFVTGPTGYGVRLLTEYVASHA